MVAPNASFGAYTSTLNQAPLMAAPTVASSIVGEFVLESNSIYLAGNTGTGGAVVALGCAENF